MMTEKGKVVFENGSEKFMERDMGSDGTFLDGYRQGHEDAWKWRPPETLPEHEGAEAILWLTTDKGFKDVSAHSYLKNGAWHWADSDEVIKRQDFIMGWLPWPEPPDT
ncbi:MAG: hypothetical protein Q8P46_03195 [Hyphomicrobiales bacterium]|nr:hypothetical protein [Hyphomicrobiales bacterium]